MSKFRPKYNWRDRAQMREAARHACTRANVRLDGLELDYNHLAKSIRLDMRDAFMPHDSYYVSIRRRRPGQRYGASLMTYITIPYPGVARRERSAGQDAL